MQNKLKAIFSKFNQEHLISALSLCTEVELEQCEQQVRRYSPEMVFEQKASWQKRETLLVFEPMPGCVNASDQKVRPSIKKTAALILAGGQGSRLGINGPKGCFPILGKSLFERLCEKIADGPAAIMTSRLNHNDTLVFFREHRSFGLPKIMFFSQDALPLLDETGRWFWEAPGRLAEGADGNGSVFKAFEQSGLLQKFIDQGIELVHIVPVDNPLADPFDPVFSSFHADAKADLSIKCIRLKDPNEPTGRLVNLKNRLAIAEFAELSGLQREQNLFANTGLLAIDVSLMSLLAKQTFPLHWARRKTPSGKWAWKGERFIVDALLYAQNAQAICYPREACFAPLKEKNSLDEIERLLLERERGNNV